MNEGPLGVIPAIPFLLIVLLAAAKWERFYLTATLVLMILCLPLYFLRKQQGLLFHPSIGRNFVVTKDLCMNIFQPEGGSSYVFLTRMGTESVCDNDRLSGADHTELIKAGTSWSVERVEVAYNNGEENDVIHAETPQGHLRVSHTELMVWDNGEKIVVEDFHRAIFFYPAKLMNWPMVLVPLFSSDGN